MQLSVRQAALQAGISRQTLFRYIKEGKISATLSHTGEKQIQVAELMRVFGALQTETVTPITASDRLRQSHRNTETPATVAYQIELERLQAQLEIRTAELALAKERIAELKTREHSSTEEKNRLLTLIEQQSRLLSAPQPAPRPPAKRAVAKKPVATKTKLTQPISKAKAEKKAKPPVKTAATTRTAAKKVPKKAVGTASKKPAAVKKSSR